MCRHGYTLFMLCAALQAAVERGGRSAGQEFCARHFVADQAMEVGDVRWGPLVMPDAASCPCRVVGGG